MTSPSQIRSSTSSPASFNAAKSDEEDFDESHFMQLYNSGDYVDLLGRMNSLKGKIVFAKNDPQDILEQLSIIPEAESLLNELRTVMREKCQSNLRERGIVITHALSAIEEATPSELTACTRDEEMVTRLRALGKERSVAAGILQGAWEHAREKNYPSSIEIIKRYFLQIPSSLDTKEPRQPMVSLLTREEAAAGEKMVIDNESAVVFVEEAVKNLCTSQQITPPAPLRALVHRFLLKYPKDMRVIEREWKECAKWGVELFLCMAILKPLVHQRSAAEFRKAFYFCKNPLKTLPIAKNILESRSLDLTRNVISEIDFQLNLEEKGFFRRCKTASMFLEEVVNGCNASTKGLLAITQGLHLDPPNYKEMLGPLIKRIHYQLDSMDNQQEVSSLLCKALQQLELLNQGTITPHTKTTLDSLIRELNDAKARHTFPPNIKDRLNLNQCLFVFDRATRAVNCSVSELPLVCALRMLLQNRSLQNDILSLPRDHPLYQYVCHHPHMFHPLQKCSSLEDLLEQIQPQVSLEVCCISGGSPFLDEICASLKRWPTREVVPEILIVQSASSLPATDSITIEAETLPGFSQNTTYDLCSFIDGNLNINYLKGEKEEWWVVNQNQSHVIEGKLPTETLHKATTLLYKRNVPLMQRIAMLKERLTTK